jgi:hypothetical protein
MLQSPNVASSKMPERIRHPTDRRKEQGKGNGVLIYQSARLSKEFIYSELAISR